MRPNLPPKLTRARKAAVVAELNKLPPVQRRRVRALAKLAAFWDWRVWVLGGALPFVGIVMLYLIVHHGQVSMLKLWITFALDALMIASMLAASLRVRSTAYRVMSLEFFNLCKRCGYDLTGNTSGVCPECGGTVSVQLQLDDVTATKEHST